MPLPITFKALMRSMIILNLFTTFNLFVFFSLLFFRRENSLPNKVLALLLINPAINFISNVIVLSGYLYQFPYFYFFAQMTCYLFAPLVYVYVDLLLGKRIKWFQPMFVVTALAMLMSFAFAIEFVLMGKQEQHAYILGLMQEPYPWQMTLVNGLFILLQQVYFSLAAFRVYKYQKKLPHVFANYSHTRVKFVTRFIGLIWILNLITICLYATLPMIEVEYIYLPIVLVAIYSFVLYFVFHHHSVFTEEAYEQFVEQSSPIYQEESEETEPEEANDPELPLITQKIERYLEETEAYTDQEFSVKSLSEAVGVPSGKISRAINQHLGKNFNELVNEKRVEKSKQLLDKADQYTIEGIGYEAGFSSRASFYRAFKKHTGVTPSDFLKQKVPML